MATPLLHDRSATTCVIADDHPPILDSLARYLDRRGFTILGTALDGDALSTRHDAPARSSASQTCACRSSTGSSSRGELAKVAPDTAVLLYSGVSDQGLVSEALDAGARGFALKDAPLDDLGRAIDTVASGGLYIDPVLAALRLRRRRGRRSQGALGA